MSRANHGARLGANSQRKIAAPARRGRFFRSCWATGLWISEPGPGASPLPSRWMKTLGVERLAAGDYAHVRPLLVDLHLGEQTHYSDHPQLSRGEVEDHLSTVPSSFAGENVIYAVRDDSDSIVGFCWIVLFDPGTGLEGEVAEVYVATEHRGRGVGELLMEQAVRPFRERRVTLGSVWTRPGNESARRPYRSAGFGA